VTLSEGAGWLYLDSLGVVGERIVCCSFSLARHGHLVSLCVSVCLFLGAVVFVVQDSLFWMKGSFMKLYCSLAGVISRVFFFF